MYDPIIETCVICNKTGWIRCRGGERYKRENMEKLFGKINSPELWDDHWKGYVSICWECLGKYWKKKQQSFFNFCKNLEQEYLKDGSPTWYQSGVMDCIDLIIRSTEEMIKSANTFDGATEAWVWGVSKVIEDIKQWWRNKQDE